LSFNNPENFRDKNKTYIGLYSRSRTVVGTQIFIFQRILLPTVVRDAGYFQRVKNNSNTSMVKCYKVQYYLGHYCYWSLKVDESLS